jgi:hypothetical protein
VISIEKAEEILSLIHDPRALVVYFVLFGLPIVLIILVGFLTIFYLMLKPFTGWPELPPEWGGPKNVRIQVLEQTQNDR